MCYYVDFSQNWLESEGIEVNEPESNGAPIDPYSESRKQAETSKSSSGPTEMDKLRKFLELDRKVLRFYCIWDDRDQMFGETRKFILHVST
jgi:EF-hand domain-containing protein 1